MNVTQFKKHLEKEGISMEMQALKDYLKAEFDIEDVPQNMVADITNDLKAKYATALATSDEYSKAIANIQVWFAECGLKYSEDRIKTKLKEFGLDATALDQGYVHRWAEQMKGEALTTTEGAPPSAPQAPTQQQPSRKQSPQAITSAVHQTVEGFVLAHDAQEKKAGKAIAKYVAGTADRVLDVALSELDGIDLTASLNSVLQQNQAAWDSAHLKIEELINSVTAA